jgi:soluble epoxide hydrolase / lipid-phosphate phosphatase
MSSEIRHRFVETNGIRMHVAEAGEGFPVVFCHGFPELWYSWRHQMRALADAGFRAIAPDMRGYGETDAPADPADYRMSILTDDIRGLLDVLGIEKAVIVGHDWGGALIWRFGLRYPERTERLVGLNTPYAPAGPVSPLEAMRKQFGHDRGFYWLYFQEPGVAEAELEADVRGNLAKVFHSARRAEDLWTFATVGGDGSGVMARIPPGETFLTDEELDVYARTFERTGFRGGLNWYRAMGLTWEEEKDRRDWTIGVPSLMVTAENDLILRPEMAEPMPQWIPGLRIEHIKNCAHWTQQEKPGEVNALLLDFLKDLRR